MDQYAAYSYVDMMLVHLSAEAAHRFFSTYPDVEIPQSAAGAVAVRLIEMAGTSMGWSRLSPHHPQPVHPDHGCRPSRDHPATAVAVATDSSQGIIDRFRTMAIARSAVITGHVIGSTLRAMIGTALVVLIAVAIGLATGTAAGASSLAAILQILPFLSGAFVPTETTAGSLSPGA